MIVIGLVLIVLAVLLFAAAIMGGGSGDVRIDLGPFDITTTPTVVFLLGAGSMLVFFLGVMSIRRGVHRAGERRRERKRIDHLSRELADARRDAGEPEPKDERRAEGKDEPTPI